MGPLWYGRNPCVAIYPSCVAQKRQEATEMQQKQMMSFLSTALQNPSMLHQLVSSRQGIQRLENGTRTRAPSLPEQGLGLPRPVLKLAGH